MQGNNDSPVNLKIQLSSERILFNYQFELQKLLKIFNFSNSIAIAQSENAFQDIKPFLNISPLKSLNFSFDEVKVAFIDWNILNTIRDSIEYVSCFLEEVNFYCTIVNLSKRTNVTGKEFSESILKSRTAFNKAGLPDKIRYLHKKFDVHSSFDEYILSINKARNCLVHRKGIVSKVDIDHEKKLMIKWNTLRFKAVSPDGKDMKYIEQNDILSQGWKLEGWLEETYKTFNLNDKISFTHDEISDTIMTLIQFGGSIFNSLLAFGSRKEE